MEDMGTENPKVGANNVESIDRMDPSDPRRNLLMISNNIYVKL